LSPAGSAPRTVALLCGLLGVTGCGLTSGSPMTDDVRPGSVGRGRPLEGAELTVTSKDFTENLILGHAPDVHRAVHADGRRRTAVGGEGDTGDDVGVPRHFAQLTVAGKVADLPELRRVVVAAAQQDAAVRAVDRWNTEAGWPYRVMRFRVRGLAS
jgi:hypothetical protein